jgi:hypothetical protein
MSDYEFCVSLRITHPNIDPEIITRTLGLLPFRTAKAGEPRMAPTGAPLHGTYEHTFWGADLHQGGNLRSTDIFLEDFLTQANSRLIPHAEFLRQLTVEGGYIEYFVGWFGSYMGATLEPTLMKATVDLGIGIGFDVYPNDEGKGT